VLCALLRFSRTKVQLQATKALILLIHESPTITNDVMVLESAFVTASNHLDTLDSLVNGRILYRAHMWNRGKLPTPNPNDPDDVRVRARMANDDTDVNPDNGDVGNDQIWFLQRSLLVLITILLDRLGKYSSDIKTDSDVGEKVNIVSLDSVRQIIIHHADTTVRWLELSVLDDTCIKTELAQRAHHNSYVHAFCVNPTMDNWIESTRTSYTKKTRSYIEAL